MTWCLANRPWRIVLLGALIAALGVPGALAALGGSAKTSSEPLMLVVMDPLAKELACACVKGHGQRDYRKLAAKLESALKEKVAIEFSDDLAETLALANAGQEVMVVGDRSLVAHGAEQAKIKCTPVCELTGQDGSTTLAAAIVVRSGDPARELKDLNGRKLYYGLAEADAKRAAALATLRAAGVEAGEGTTRGTYTDAALDVLDSSLNPPPFAIIPAYGVALLEGCGSVKPRELRVIGTSASVPFITAFLSEAIAPEKRQKITGVLVGLKNDRKLLQAMESKEGFKELKTSAAVNTPSTAAGPGWPDWRGPKRDGHVDRLPARLPERLTTVWKKPAMSGSLAGISVSGQRLILAERDFAEEHDVYRCLNTETGELLWRIQFRATGTLDYGQSPRATPVIEENRAYLLGAFGHLRCIDVATGKLIWQRNLPREFKAELPTWGMCSPPLIVDDLLIVNPGGTNASVVALEKKTGRTRWAAPGLPAAYSAFICGEFGGRRQIIGYDRESLGGWDVKSGQRLWKLEPPTQGDFNVPTPIPVEGGIVICTENNGTRFHRFDNSGKIVAEPVGTFAELKPDSATPVATRGRIFGAHMGLRCLDITNGLKQVWEKEDDAIGDYATVVADDERVLVITLGGELILLDARADQCTVISRVKLFDDDVEVYSHPALVGSRLFVRGGPRVVCVDLASPNPVARASTETARTN